MGGGCVLVCSALLLDQLRSRDRVTHPPRRCSAGAVVQALLRWGGRVETRFTVGGKHNTQLGPAET